MGVDGQHHAPAALPPGKDPVPIVHEAGWTPGPVWTGKENLAPPPAGIRSPDRPARSESLYRLSYPGPYMVVIVVVVVVVVAVIVVRLLLLLHLIFLLLFLLLLLLHILLLRLLLIIIINILLLLLLLFLPLLLLPLPLLPLLKFPVQPSYVPFCLWPLPACCVFPLYLNPLQERPYTLLEIFI